MRPKNSQNMFVKECMETALIALMQQKRYEDITITDITKKAGVSRMSFYRNYTGKDDIVHAYFHEKVRMFSNNCKEADLPHDAVILSLVSLLRSSKNMIQALIRSDNYHLIIRDFDSTIRNIITEHCRIYHSSFEPEYYAVCFIIGGLQRLLIEWAKNDMQESDEYMASLFYNLQNNINTLLD